jgi:general secretion pathway protein E
MNLLNSDNLLDLLDLLERQQILTGRQRQRITLERGKQRLKLLKRADDNGARDADKSYPDLVDIIDSFQLEIEGRKGELLNAEAIMQAVALEFRLPFKKLDPLALDMDVVTRSIPKNFAVSHLLLPL